MLRNVRQPDIRILIVELSSECSSLSVSDLEKTFPSRTKFSIQHESSCCRGVPIVSLNRPTQVMSREKRLLEVEVELYEKLLQDYRQFHEDARARVALVREANKAGNSSETLERAMQDLKEACQDLVKIMENLRLAHEGLKMYPDPESEKKV